jgi:hypothetical protein
MSIKGDLKQTETLRVIGNPRLLHMCARLARVLFHANLQRNKTDIDVLNNGDDPIRMG